MGVVGGDPDAYLVYVSSRPKRIAEERTVKTGELDGVKDFARNQGLTLTLRTK